MSTIEILKVQFDAITLNDSITRIERFINSGKQHYIVTPNPEIVLKCQEKPAYREIINSASLRVPDGVGIVWAGYIQFKIKNSKFKINNAKFKIIIGILRLLEILIGSFVFVFYFSFYRKSLECCLPERVTGTDLMLEICENLRCRVFLLGAEDGVAEKVKTILEQRKFNAQVVGTYAGNTQKESARKIISLINKCRPDILFVAFGAPSQEIWIHEHLKELPSVKVAVGVGGSFDTISGKIPRAPLLFQKLGLEWAWRFYKEPRRYKRMFNALIAFPLKVIQSILNLKK